MGFYKPTKEEDFNDDLFVLWYNRSKRSLLLPVWRIPETNYIRRTPRKLEKKSITAELEQKGLKAMKPHGKHYVF